MAFLVEVVTNRMKTWKGIVFSVEVNGYLGVKMRSDPNYHSVKQNIIPRSYEQYGGHRCS